jgi:hypothetical protein
MKKPIETYWTYEIAAVEGDKFRSLVISPNDTLELALAGAFKDAGYYIGVCGYQVAVAFEEHCKACNGSGRVAKKRLQWSPCKVCKGQPTLRTTPMTPWHPSEKVAITEK